MTNIKTLMDSLSTINDPLLFHIAYTCRRTYGYIFLQDTYEPIYFDNVDEEVLIEESVYPLLFELNIKIEPLKTKLLELHKILGKLSFDEIQLLNGVQVAKDRNNVLYKVHLNQLEYYKQIDLFFKGQKTTWDLLAFDSIKVAL